MLRQLRRQVSNLQRKAYFFGYNVKPFRFKLVWNHAVKRLASTLGIKRGFRIIDLALSYHCNLKCQHCSAMVMKSESERLSLDDYRRIVDQAGELDVLSWNLTGGEALLVKWLDDLIPILKPDRHYITIQTNGLLLTEDRAKSLADLGVNCITTSIDSVDPEEHDAFRGADGAYEKTFRAVAHARQAGMQVLIGGTVTHQNLRSDNLRRLIEKSNDAGAMFIFNLAVPCGEWAGCYDSVLRDGDRRYLRHLMEEYPRTTTDQEVGRNAVGCPAGVEKIYVTPYGDVIPCPFIQVSFGNVREQTLKQIVSEMQRIHWFGEYQDVCIAAEDRRFHGAVLETIYCGQDAIPAPHTAVFGKRDHSEQA